MNFIDASDWLELSWYNSGGTRAKKVLQSNDGREWYFKCSERKEAKGGNPEKYYKYEFWSEIIAYQVGKQLGLNILEYRPALHNNQVGCISPMMINVDKEQLTEVGRLMTAINSNFNPEENNTRNQYTFQLLDDTLKYFGLTDYWDFFFQTLLFDAIIGNTDRHQENWAFIEKTSSEQIGIERKSLQSNILKMAPIYDSGSSLGRELSEERVEQLLNDERQLKKYIDNGKSEVHWQNIKLSHFDLVESLLKSSYLEEVRKAGEFVKNWNDEAVNHLIMNIDSTLPVALSSFNIPEKRKDLIIKLLIMRAQKLNELLYGGV